MKELKIIIRCDVKEEYLKLRPEIYHFLDKISINDPYHCLLNNLPIEGALPAPDSKAYRLFLLTIAHFLDRFCHLEFENQHLPVAANNVLCLSSEYLNASMEFCRSNMSFLISIFSSEKYWRAWPNNPVEIKLTSNLYLDLIGKFDL